MTMKDILKAYLDGEKLEIKISSSVDEYDPISAIIIKFVIDDKRNASIPIQPSMLYDYNNVRIRRETFGFSKAVSLLQNNKYIKKGDYVYRIINGRLKCQHYSSYKSGHEWWDTNGYPLDWPDYKEFYEVEG